MNHIGKYGSCMCEIFILKDRFMKRRQVYTHMGVVIVTQAIQGIQIPIHVCMHNLLFQQLQA